MNIEWVRSPQQEAWLDTFGVKWRYEDFLGIAAINREASLRRQSRGGEKVDLPTVEKMKLAVEMGIPFPAIIVYKHAVTGRQPYRIIDGNHRTALAADESTESYTMPAYVVEGADADMISLMIESANNNHGRLLDEDTRRANAYAAHERGWPIRQIALLFGYTNTQLQQIFAERRGLQRLAQAGLKPKDNPPVTVLRAIGRLDADQLGELGQAFLNQNGEAIHGQIMRIKAAPASGQDAMIQEIKSEVIMNLRAAATPRSRKGSAKTTTSKFVLWSKSLIGMDTGSFAADALANPNEMKALLAKLRTRVDDLELALLEAEEAKESEEED